MRRAFALLPLGLCLMAFRCGDNRPAVEFPTLPDLSAQTVTPCPEAELLTGGYDDLVTKDARLALEYARCKARAATAVGAYQDAQRLLKQASDKANGQKGPPKIIGTTAP